MQKLWGQSKKTEFLTKLTKLYITCVANTSSSPTEKSAMNPYKPFKQKEIKQNIAPKKVAPERSCNGRQEKNSIS